MTKSVSIIILNHNGESYLRDCIDSLLALEYPDNKYEIVVVDNNSRDNSIPIVEGYRSVHLIKNPVNMGFAEANNLAAKRVSSEYIAFLNNDMKVDKKWLSELLSPTDEEDGIACVGSKILNWDGSLIDFAGGNINFMGMGIQKDYNRPASRTPLEKGFIPFACGGSMLISRKVFLDVGGFDKDYVFFNEDVDLGWRLWLYGYKVIFSPDAVSYHRHHGTGERVLTDAQRHAFCDRNSLITMIKNLEEKNLGRFLPITLMLGTLRIPALTGIDTSSFFFDPSDEEGNPSPDTYNVKSRALSWIAAVENVAMNLEKIIEKREEIQKRRVLSDEELFSRFDGFLNTGYFGSRYWQEFKNIIQTLPPCDFGLGAEVFARFKKEAEHEQIELQKEHIKELEGIIFEREKELESAKTRLEELKEKNSELESFALKVHKNPLFRIYSNLKKAIKK